MPPASATERESQINYFPCLFERGDAGRREFLRREADRRTGVGDIGLPQAAGSEYLTVNVGAHPDLWPYMQYTTGMVKQAQCVRLHYCLTKWLRAEVETENVQTGSIVHFIRDERPTYPLSGAGVTGR